MPVYEIGLDDGRKLHIEADNQEAALAGVAHFKASEGATQAPAEAPSISHRAMQIPTGFNETLADTVGAPVDAVSWGLGKLGLPVSSAPFAGSQSIKNGLGLIGANPDNAPAVDSTDQLLRATGSGVAGAMVPEAAVAGLGSKVLNPQMLAAAKTLVGDGSAPITTAATGAAAGLGSEAASQATQGTPYQPLARMAGGMAGGALAGRLAARMSQQGPQAIKGIDAVDAEKSAAYNDPALKGYQFDQNAIGGLGNAVKTQLQAKDLFREDHPAVFNAIDRLQNNTGPVSWGKFDAVRQTLGDLAGQTQDFKPTRTAKAAMTAKQMLNDFEDRIATTPSISASGNGPAAADAIARARGNAASAIRAGQVDSRLNNAEVNNAVTNSSLNLGNRIRQSVAKPYMLNNEAKMNAWSPETQELARKLGKGDTIANAMRLAGNAIGGAGISFFPGAYIGHAALGPVGTALPAVGMALKYAGGRYAAKQAKNLSNALLSEAPANAQIVAGNRALKAANAKAASQKTTSAALRGAAIGLLRKAGGAS